MISAGYEAISALIHDAMAGHATVLKPKAQINLMARFFSAMRRTQTHPSSYICELWGAKDLNEVARYCNTSADRLRSILQGRQNRKNVWATIAVMSAAAALFKGKQSMPEQSQLDLRSKCLPSDEFTKRLLHRIGELGFPEMVGHYLLRGQEPPRKVVPRLRLPLLLGTLNGSDRRELDRRQAAHLAGNKHPELDAISMREFTTRAIAQGARSRMGLKTYNHWALTWMERHDAEWLDHNLPLYGIPLDQETARVRVQARLRQGLTARSQIARVEVSAFNWLRDNDCSWLDSVLPLRTLRRRVKTMDVSFARKLAAELIREGVTERVELAREDPSLYRWLLKNDPQFLDQAFSRRQQPRDWSKISISEARLAALTLVQGGPKLRSRIHDQDRSLYRWLRTYDCEWFSSEFPLRIG